MTRNQWIAIIAVILLVLLVVAVGVAVWLRARRRVDIDVETTPVANAGAKPIRVAPMNKAQAGPQPNVPPTYRVGLGRSAS